MSIPVVTNQNKFVVWLWGWLICTFHIYQIWLHCNLYTKIFCNFFLRFGDPNNHITSHWSVPNQLALRWQLPFIFKYQLSGRQEICYIWFSGTPKRSQIQWSGTSKLNDICLSLTLTWSENLVVGTPKWRENWFQKTRKISETFVRLNTLFFCLFEAFMWLNFQNSQYFPFTEISCSFYNILTNPPW